MTKKKNKKGEFLLEVINPFTGDTLGGISKKGEKMKNTKVDTANEQDEPEELDSWTTVVNIKHKKRVKAVQGVMQPPKTL